MAHQLSGTVILLFRCESDTGCGGRWVGRITLDIVNGGRWGEGNRKQVNDLERHIKMFICNRKRLGKYCDWRNVRFNFFVDLYYHKQQEQAKLDNNNFSYSIEAQFSSVFCDTKRLSNVTSKVIGRPQSHHGAHFQSLNLYLSAHPQEDCLFHLLPN